MKKEKSKSKIGIIVIVFIMIFVMVASVLTVFNWSGTATTQEQEYDKLLMQSLCTDNQTVFFWNETVYTPCVEINDTGCFKCIQNKVWLQ